MRIGSDVISLQSACRRIVSGDPELFSPDVVSSDPLLRKEAIDLLVSLSEKAPEVRRILSAAADRCPDEAVKRDVRRGLLELDDV